MKKKILFTIFILNSLNTKSQQVIPAISIISIETNAAIIQKKAKPFQLSSEYYQIFKELNIKNTIQVNDLFKVNVGISKRTVFYPLFKQTVLLKLAKQIMLSNEQEDIDCAKNKLIDFAHLFVGAINTSSTLVPCGAAKSELAAQVAVLNSIYSTFYKYEPIERLLSLPKINTSKKLKIDKINDISCIGLRDFRTDMNIDFLNAQPKGNGQNTKFTLVENGYITRTNANLNTVFSNTINPKLHDSSFFKNIALRTPSSEDFIHAQKDISILFDSNIINGVCKSADIMKIFFFHNNCMLNAVYAEYEALLEAIVETPRNGILLLEFGAGSSNSFPAEKEPILFELIKFATKYKNIVVIEPAGNLGSDIATMTYTPKYIPTRTCNPINYNDSGAIIVGGAEANPTSDMTGIYRKVVNKISCNTISNFGNRVDCYAQGEYVNTNYGNHSSTSSASAIVAGLAVNIQSIAKAKYGSFLTPVQMRYLLSRPSSIKVKQIGFSDKYIPVITESFLLELDRLFSNCPPNCPPER